MKIVLSIDGVQIIDKKPKSNCRVHKGKSILSFVNDFTLIDLETTGFDTCFDEIIEICAIRVRNGIVEQTFNKLVKPSFEIDEFITELTGITNEMLVNEPTICEVLPEFIDFIGNDIIVGHNVNFDINFIYDNNLRINNKYFSNSYIDTLRLSRKLLPDLKHHRLKDLIKYFEIPVDKQHRAQSDCESTLYCYNKLKELAISAYGNVDVFNEKFSKKKQNANYDLKQITTSNLEFDETNPFFGKVCVFTGTLEKMKRTDAAQIVVDLGGECGNSVTKKTNYLILGNNDYNPKIKDGKSTKQKKAEELKIKGNDIEIISENTFYDMLNI